MATKQVNIDIIAKDKTRMAMQSATKGVDKLKSSVFNLRNALLGLGAGFVAKGFLDTAREVERLRVRFKFLFDDANEGAKAFDNLVKFAGQVPFSLQEIQRGSANLAVVSKNAEELNTLLKITGDIASASGLDFATTSEQIQRTFSSGINSADLFRERGVKALLGFEAGVQISAEKSRKHILDAFRDGTLSVVGASEDMAKTFDGTLSMIGDKFTQFQIKVMDASPFVALKTTAQLIEKELAKNFGSIEKFAEKVGDAIVSSTAKVLIFGSQTLDAMKPVFNFLGESISNLVNFVRGLPSPIDTLGVIGFLMLGTKGKLIVAVLAGVMDNIRSMLGDAVDAFAFMQEKMAQGLNKIFLLSDKRFEEVKNQVKELRDMADRLQTPMSELGDAIEQAGDNGIVVFKGLGVEIDTSKIKAGSLTEALLKNLQIINEMIEKQKGVNGGQSFLTGSEMDGTKKQIEEVGMLQQAYQSFTGGFMESVNSQKDGFKQIENIGKQSFGRLKQTLTDFVMTGKLNFGDFAKFVVRSLLEMLIGQAVKMAFTKSMSMFKMDAIKKAMISLYEGAMKTFASIPFPLNIVAVGGALAFGAGIINKIKGFEKGGRPPVGQPSIVGEKGAELFVPDQAGTIVPNDKLGMGKPVTVNFNINTVDARGFNELLVNSRGVIVNMINQAVNEKGRMAII